MGLLEETVDRISLPDFNARSKAMERLDQLTMPHWALGRLMDLAVELAGMTASVTPAVDERVVVVMAG
ncbi:MAG TPA: nicotinate-nucleotide--dimethylbenzimidazole phosphoribosyltransferase, partial [Desulfomonilaceae bacterium]|nr:nicotinate-nucleotide--dimethylbenzimidazole phosphoribosyltransferase [Desulfomonilaceae bacterium]